ncbi:MAG: MBL fold metallo-hydrolase, partial [Turicibacter sp.]|nr:MBL fold metallo-hydrolase [Turicibacter sp.]
KISKTFKHTSIDLGNQVFPLPADGSIPFMPDWKWVLVPGHTEGQIVLFRESDRVLIAADSFTTVKQESLLSVLSQHEKVSGPPKYFTTNWEQAKQSLQKIIDLNPKLAIVSHGQPIEGENLKQHLDQLMNHFDEIAKPHHGKFVE